MEPFAKSMIYRVALRLFEGVEAQGGLVSEVVGVRVPVPPMGMLRGDERRYRRSQVRQEPHYPIAPLNFSTPAVWAFAPTRTALVFPAKLQRVRGSEAGWADSEVLATPPQTSRRHPIEPRHGPFV